MAAQMDDPQQPFMPAIEADRDAVKPQPPLIRLQFHGVPNDLAQIPPPAVSGVSLQVQKCRIVNDWNMPDCVDPR